MLSFNQKLIIPLYLKPQDERKILDGAYVVDIVVRSSLLARDHNKTLA